MPDNAFHDLPLIRHLLLIHQMHFGNLYSLMRIQGRTIVQVYHLYFL